MFNLGAAVPMVNSSCDVCLFVVNPTILSIFPLCLRKTFGLVLNITIQKIHLAAMKSIVH